MLALGLAAYDVPSSSRPTAAAVRGIRKTRAWGLEYARGADSVLGAYAVGAGLSRAEEARALLLGIRRTSTATSSCAATRGSPSVSWVARRAT